MATGSILLGVALLVLVGLYVARPFLRPPVPEAASTEYQLLQDEKEVLLDQIQALDFDHETGKIPSELHAFQREKLVEQATAVLQALDAAEGLPASAVSGQTTGDIDSEIEAAVARLRRQRSQTPAPDPVPMRNGQTRFCSQCGTPTDPGDKFCAHCGHKLILIKSTKTA